MIMQSIGDLSQQFSSLRNTSALKTSLAVLTDELSNQRKSDLTAHLRGATTNLESIEREIVALESYSFSAKEVDQRLRITQTALESIDNVRANQAQIALAINSESNAAQIADATTQSQQAFERIVSLFNSRSGEMVLFGGARTDSDPLARPEDMLADLTTQISGMSSADDIIVAVSDWFEDPSGGFQTLGYLGDTGPFVENRVGPNAIVQQTSRADSDATRSLLKAAAIGALADSIGTLPLSEQAKLLKASGQEMLVASDSLVRMQANVGIAQMNIEEAQVTNSAQLAAFSIDKNSLISADPFETATRLQELQQQLEIHFAATARLSQLSLVNYL